MQEWIYNLQENEATLPMSIILGLLNRRKTKYDFQAAAQEILPILNDFYTLCPQKIRQQKSPLTLEKERQARGKEPSLVLSRTDFSAWQEHFQAGMTYFKQNKLSEALEEYNKTFDSLLENKTTYPEIFRVFANRATVCLARGDNYLGQKMLDIALELNPHYDFAQLQKKRSESGQFDGFIQQGFLNTLDKIVKDKNFPLNIWDWEKIRTNWPTEKIFSQLEKFAIHIQPKDFLKMSKGIFSSDELANKYLYPRYQGEEKKEDFLWMASLILWERLLPEVPCKQVLSQWLEDARDLAEKQKEKLANIENEIAIIEKRKDKLSYSAKAEKREGEMLKKMEEWEEQKIAEDIGY